jgi:hypothetical protein
MQVKTNNHGVYLFFPSDGESIEKSLKEADMLAEFINFLGLWDLYKCVWAARTFLQNKLFDKTVAESGTETEDYANDQVGQNTRAE